MFTLRVEAPVSSLRPACFFIRDAEGRLLARIREIRGGSLLRRLLFYTRFRAALRLILEVEEYATGRRLLLERPFILPRMRYRLVAEDGSPIWQFEEQGFLIPHYRILSR